MSSLARREVATSASRDLTAKVMQVKDILPQFSEDQICLVLADSDEDVMRAVETLMSQPDPKERSRAQKAETRTEKRAEPEVQAAPIAESPEPVEKRPPTAAEREVLKWRKKMREVEKIEAMRKDGQKLDKMQEEKLGKRSEIEIEIEKALVALTFAEKAEREAAEAAAREKARVEAEEKAAREKAAREERERAQQERAAKQREEARTKQQSGSRNQNQQGMDLLRMVQGTAPAPQNLPPMPTPPQQSRSQVGERATVLPPPRSAAPGAAQPAAQPRAPRWADEASAAPKMGLDDITEYSTRLDLKAVPKHVQEKADRIAAEIEAEQGGPPKGKGKGDGFRSKGEKGKGKGKDKEGKDRDGKGDRRYDDEKGRKGGMSPNGKGGDGPRGPPREANDSGFDEWVANRRALPRPVRS